MKVLVVGGGGREHALAWKIAQSPLLTRLYAAPGNPGIAAIGECVDIAATDVPRLVDFAKNQAIDLVVVGPEAPLAAGLVDALDKVGVLAFGPKQAGARIESSKQYAKDLMRRHSIPTARYQVFDHYERCLAALADWEAPLVVKADGLAAGKGVFVCETMAEAEAAVKTIMRDNAFGDQAGARVVIEEKLEGEEASILALLDGRTIAPLEPSQDHKRIGEGDTGPNTGGMGAYSPTPAIDRATYERIERDILLPSMHALNEEDQPPYRGLLYVGLMLTAEGPMVLEYNCRFGDPETQPVLMRLKSDLLPILLATAQGRLDSCEIEWDERPAVCVVLASKGYPGSYEKGKPISGIEAHDDAMVFQAGTRMDDGQLVTNGGRVLGVTALGATLREARDRAYKVAWPVVFDGKTLRNDIASRGLDRLDQ